MHTAQCIAQDPFLFAGRGRFCGDPFLPSRRYRSSRVPVVSMPRPSTRCEELFPRVVIAVGIETDHWRTLKEEFPEILNCCVNVTKAFQTEYDESIAKSGFDQPTRARMLAKDTWDAVLGVCLAVLYAFGLLVTVCNHETHRSLSVAFEVVTHQGIELVSIRTSRPPFRDRDVREFMAAISPRLMQHAARFRDVPHPVTGFDVCTHGFDGIYWRNHFDVESEYLVLRRESLVVNVRRDDEEAQGWQYGILANGSARGDLGWYPLGMVSPISRPSFQRVNNLLGLLVFPRVVLAVGLETDHWRALKEEFPEILNCCVNVTKAFQKETGESTDGSGFDQPTRARMMIKDTWNAVLGVSLAVLYAFGLVILLCNHGRHRSLSVAFEVATHQGIELVSIRNPRPPYRLRDVGKFMAAISPRLRQHAARFRDVPHPVTGFEVCTHGFDGLYWRTHYDAESEYLVLPRDSLVVNVRRDEEEAQGWHFGILANGAARGDPGWYPPCMVSPMPGRYFHRVNNLIRHLVMNKPP